MTDLGLFEPSNAVDFSDAFAKGRHLVGIGLDRHQAHIVELLLQHLEVTIFNQFHHVVHGKIRK